jgi:hypothetical protein
LTHIPLRAEAGPTNDFSQYTARFFGIGATAGAYSGSGTSLWYSFNDGLVHWVALHTELWPQGGTDEQIASFLEWLAADLAAVDRAATPWVFVFGHRQQWMKGAGGWGKMDPLLHEYHVQLGFFGHEHNYQVRALTGRHGRGCRLTGVVMSHTGLTREFEEPCGAGSSAACWRAAGTGAPSSRSYGLLPPRCSPITRRAPPMPCALAVCSACCP